MEIIEFNFDGKLFITGGLNNQLRVWDNEFNLKHTIDEGPDSSCDVNFVRWHPKGNVFIAGGNDNMIWMMNGLNGQFINCFSGHKEEVI